jgi:hypothetical protein
VRSKGARSRAEYAPQAVHRVQPGEYRTTEEAPYGHPWAFMATSTTLLSTANENRLTASTRRLGARAGPKSKQENASSETDKAPSTPGARHHETAELETENGSGFQAEEGDDELSVAQAQAVLDGRYA